MTEPTLKDIEKKAISRMGKESFTKIIKDTIKEVQDYYKFPTK